MGGDGVLEVARIADQRPPGAGRLPHVADLAGEPERATPHRLRIERVGQLGVDLAEKGAQRGAEVASELGHEPVPRRPPQTRTSSWFVGIIPAVTPEP